MISQTGFFFAENLPVAGTITAHGETLYISEWAKRLGISEDTLNKRLAAGWSHEEAVTAPKQVTNRPRASRGQRTGLVSVGDQVPDGAPGSWTWYELPYERDTWARDFVEAHPDGASMEEVGAVMGVEVSWICEIEQGAFKKLKQLLARVAAGGFDSLSGQLALVGGRDNAADIDLGAFLLLELLVERLDLAFGDDDEDDRGEEEEEESSEEWEGEVLGVSEVHADALPQLEAEDDEAARWLRENEVSP